MITIATDGSCIGNPGPGAYAFYADIDGHLVRRAIPSSATTVGEMEVRALLEALLFISDFIDQQPEPVLIQCDSQYVVNGYNDWMAGWKAKGWRKKGGLAHTELWKQIDATKSRLQSPVTVTWVRAHQNNGSLNDRVDAIANYTARSQVAVNGPALQDTLELLPTPTEKEPLGSTIAAALDVSSSEDRLVNLLRSARDMIDRLAARSDAGAHELSREITAELKKH